MYCPSCRAEFRSGFTRCQGCDVDLVSELPPQSFFPDVKDMAAALAERDTLPLLVGTLKPLKEAQERLRQARIMSAVVADQNQDDSPSMHDRLLLLVAKDDVEAAHRALGAAWNELLVREGTAHEGATLNVGRCPACDTPLPEGALDAEEPVECAECGLVV